MNVNRSEPIGRRIVSVNVLCSECSPQRYDPIDVRRTYRIVSSQYIAEGGDGYTVIADNMRNYRYARARTHKHTH